MPPRTAWKLLALASAIASLGIVVAAAQTSRPIVILVSLDGWRADYHRKAAVPNLRSLMARGVHAEGLIPSFPTKTFPNHYTLVTGLYPGHHGIVGNSVRDPHSGRVLTMQRREEVADPMWWGGEPIWNALQRAGGRAAPIFWPGAEAPIGGMRPTYWEPFDHDRSSEARVDRSLELLARPAAERPSFLTLYISDVDGAGHTYGPDAPELTRALERTDAVLGRLLRGLDRQGLTNSVNLVVVSDHGMAETSRRRVVVIEDLIAPSDGEIVDLNPTLGLWPRSGREEEVYRKLASAHPRLTVYRRSQTPAHWHYRDHERVPPIVGVMDEGWSLLRRAWVGHAFSRNPRGVGGNHGYDPRVPSMRGLFVAAGPAFREGVTVPAFENVHVYAAMCRILGLRPAPHDGDPAVAASFLRR